MTAILEDILGGLRLHLVANLTGMSDSDVVLSYPDERLVETIEKVGVSPLSFVLDLSNRYSGISHIITKDQAAITAWLADPENAPVPTAAMKRLPLPFLLYVQIDTYCEKQYDDLLLTSEISALLASGVKFTTAEGRTYRPRLDPGADMSDLSDGFHRVHRCSIQVWIDDPHEVTEVALVVRVIFDINGQQLTIGADDV